MKDKIADKYREQVEKAASILNEAGCEEVYLFGSIAENRGREDSDIDLAVRGCPPGMYFELLGKLMLELDSHIDLVNLDKEDSFTHYLETEGSLIHVS